MQSQQILSLRTTPSRRQYCQDLLSERITKGRDYGSWPTPCTRDHKGGYEGGRMRNGKVSTDSLDVTAQLTAKNQNWPTPCASDSRDRGDWESPAIQRRVKIGKSIELTMLVGSVVPPTGKQSSGSNAKTEKRVRYRLNPMFSLWLMGYPKSWIERAIPTSTRTQMRLKV